MSLCSILVEKTFLITVLGDHGPPKRNVKDGARPWLPKGRAAPALAETPLLVLPKPPGTRAWRGLRGVTSALPWEVTALRSTTAQSWVQWCKQVFCSGSQDTGRTTMAYLLGLSSLFPAKERGSILQS